MKVENSTKDYYASSKERHYSHPTIQAFSLPKYRWINQQLDIKGKSVLDIGSGNGYFAQHFEKDCELTALDLSANQLQYNPASRKQVGSAYEIPFADNSFDIVFCSNLLHHLDQPENAVKEMARVARQHVIINEPNRNNPMLFVAALLIPHERRAIYSSRKYLTDMVEAAGLSINTHTYLGGFVMPNITPAFMLKPAMAETQKPFSFFQLLIAEKTALSRERN